MTERKFLVRKSLEGGFEASELDPSSYRTRIKIDGDRFTGETPHELGKVVGENVPRAIFVSRFPEVINRKSITNLELELLNGFGHGVSNAAAKRKRDDIESREEMLRENGD